MFKHSRFSARTLLVSSALILAAIAGVDLLVTMMASAAPPDDRDFDGEITRHAQAMLSAGKTIFRYETFGSEAFWADVVQLHTAIAGYKHGGVWSGCDPITP